jgi:hypothetical protein
MALFNDTAFADLTQVFDSRKGQIVLPQVITAEPTARVILYATTSLRARVAQSRFVSLATLLPTVKPRFITASAKAIKPVMIEIAPVLETPKARTTLRLKTKIALPSIQSLSRKSTVQDLAAAFKAEKALMEKTVAAAPAEQSPGGLGGAFTKRRRHPLSDKPWSELLAEADTPKPSKNNFDMAAAFKAEMKAFMAAQERMGEAAVSPPAPIPFKAAATPKVLQQKPSVLRLAA